MDDESSEEIYDPPHETKRSPSGYRNSADIEREIWQRSSNKKREYVRTEKGWDTIDQMQKQIDNLQKIVEQLLVNQNLLMQLKNEI